MHVHSHALPTQKLVCYFALTYIILLTRADDRILPQGPVP
jgi:hypothetical protein